MIKKHLPLLVAMATLLGAGCAGVPKVLPPEARATIRETQVRSHLPQNEITLQFIPAGYGTGGGLLGALIDASIDSARSSKSRDQAARLREAVRGEDFRGRYWHAISNVVAETPWVQMAGFVGIPSGDIRVTSEMVAHNAVLNLGTDYMITPDLRVFRVDLGLSVFAPGKPKRAAAANMVFYYSAPVGDAEGGQAVDLWIAEDAAAYRKAAGEGIEESARLLRYALALMVEDGSATGRPAKIKADLVHGRGDFGIPAGRAGLKGSILEETTDRIIFHAATGNLYSLPREAVKITYLDKE